MRENEKDPSQKKEAKHSDIQLGRWNSLAVTRKVDFGLYLDGGEEGEVLLPTRYMPKEWAEGDKIDVFVYLDNEERLIATTEKPFAQVGDFAFLKVAWVNEYGAFLSWGPMKDLFVPFREQKMRMEVGNSYIVYIYIDELTYRIVATAKVDKYLDEAMPPYKSGDTVDCLVWQKTDLGFKAIVENRFGGLIYGNEVFRHLHVGDNVKAFVKLVRPDGKIDLSLQPSGMAAVEGFAPQLLDYLRQHDGHAPYGDKSPADDIYEEFGVSKKVFKKAIGDLYRQHLITLEDGGIRIIVED
jgi:predicted RNA-binding protein (virulence factor B family)